MNILKDNYLRYQQQSVNTATPQELTLMLYNGCIKFLNLAQIAMEQKNMEQKNLNIQKAENIIDELNLTLDMKYEVSKNLRSLYDFIYQKMIDANITNDQVLLEEIKVLVSDIRDTWKEAMLIANRSK